MDFGDSLSSPRTTSDVMCVVEFTHVALEEPHAQGEHEECLVMQVIEGSSDMDIDS